MPTRKGIKDENLSKQGGRKATFRAVNTKVNSRSQRPVHSIRSLESDKTGELVITASFNVRMRRLAVLEDLQDVPKPRHRQDS
ncbi:hypothetical protein K227x_15780 [Rubripirellula lacrimiformis]|uniref:Uncharacterized protein n=1 Tax=Rubripirellula lacrimiformis TaxID=1930273 RepID=A0A517N7S4_9BACT|nr:hypothetical protein K227x_15780 [Rubripirellula lacrimiformis]